MADLYISASWLKSRRILSDEWPPGHRIPFEHELQEQFECSRMTVSKVTTQLAGAGLIERRRKAGSFVRHQQSQSAVLKIQDIRDEVVSTGAVYRYEIVSKRRLRANAVAAPKLDLNSGESVLEVICLHFAGERPFCVENRLINLIEVPEILKEDFASMPLGTWLSIHVPWTVAEHRIRAVVADASMAQWLQRPAGTACLVIERRTWRAERAVTSLHLTIRAMCTSWWRGFRPTKPDLP